MQSLTTRQTLVLAGLLAAGLPKAKRQVSALEKTSTLWALTARRGEDSHPESVKKMCEMCEEER